MDGIRFAIRLSQQLCVGLVLFLRNTIYSPEAKLSWRIMEILYGAKKIVFTRSANSAESEPILMKSGAL